MLMNWTRRTVSALALTIGVAMPALADGYAVDLFVPGSDFHGVHGLGIDPNGQLYAGSVIGQSIYNVDRATGKVGVEIANPDGMADDIAFAPDGTMAWTGFITGDIYVRAPGGTVKKLASGLPGINSLAYRSDGRLYASQVFIGDALYEIDTSGETPPRKIIEGMGGLNGFQFGPDDKIYGPLWFKGQVVRIDADTGDIETVADGFKVPAAVNLDSKGNIWVVDTALGQLVKIDPVSGDKAMVAQLSTSLDNLAIDDQDRIFVSNMADNGIQEIDPETGAVRQVVKGALASPGGIALIADDDGSETLYLADLFAYRTIDAATGAVTDVARMQADHLEYPFNARANKDHVILSSWFTSSVQVFDRKTGESLHMFHNFAAPQDAVELADGSYLVAELATGSLVNVSGEHGDTREVLIDGLVLPVGLVLKDQGVYVTEAGAGTVSRVDLANGAKTVVAEGLVGPEGIDIAPDGTLIVAEAGKQRVISIDPATGAVTELAASIAMGVVAAKGTPPTYVTSGVAVGGNGSIYVVSDVENAIYRLTPQ
ncbi:PQQ-binding-like beta-propeller repeat protein [Thalassovita gelatinovora]|nr:PQQ-binding-like beta-propeller repeat protein [Thalassovita gelatinovora]